MSSHACAHTETCGEVALDWGKPITRRNNDDAVKVRMLQCMCHLLCASDGGDHRWLLSHMCECPQLPSTAVDSEVLAKFLNLHTVQCGGQLSAFTSKAVRRGVAFDCGQAVKALIIGQNRETGRADASTMNQTTYLPQAQRARHACLVSCSLIGGMMW